MNDDGTRRTVEVSSPEGGWPHPWPNVAELAHALPSAEWTLIGGLMVQLHTINLGIGITRPTNDVDIALHIETSRGVAERTARALESLGYRFSPAFGVGERVGHRWVRDSTVTDASTPETVDVVTADHAAPRVRERMRGHDMVAVDGGTQALRRTINARLQILSGEPTTISVPRPFGALVLKSAAHRADSRDRDRHLYDAVALLACIDDPFAEREGFVGSDRPRMQHLADQLPTSHALWLTVPAGTRQQARDALAILSGDG